MKWANCNIADENDMLWTSSNGLRSFGIEIVHVRYFDVHKLYTCVWKNAHSAFFRNA